MTREAQRRAAAGALGNKHLCRGLRAVDFWELGGSSGWNKCGSGGTGAEGAAGALASVKPWTLGACTTAAYLQMPA